MKTTAGPSLNNLPNELRKQIFHSASGATRLIRTDAGLTTLTADQNLLRQTHPYFHQLSADMASRPYTQHISTISSWQDDVVSSVTEHKQVIRDLTARLKRDTDLNTAQTLVFDAEVAKLRAEVGAALSAGSGPDDSELQDRWATALRAAVNIYRCRRGDASFMPDLRTCVVTATASEAYCPPRGSYFELLQTLGFLSASRPDVSVHLVCRPETVDPDAAIANSVPTEPGDLTWPKDLTTMSWYGPAQDLPALSVTKLWGSVGREWHCYLGSASELSEEELTALIGKVRASARRLIEPEESGSIHLHVRSQCTLSATLKARYSEMTRWENEEGSLPVVLMIDGAEYASAMASGLSAYGRFKKLHKSEDQWWDTDSAEE